MIRYDLICDQGHEFDGWFRDSAAYDSQSRRGLLSCAVCGSAKIDKQLMAPGIMVKSNRRTEAPQKMVAGPLDPRARAMLEVMREMRKTVEENAEYVGDRFAEEARRIHFEESEKRGIYGEATQNDARALIEEGIEVHPLPRLPEDGN
ncbi:MAG: DUF1178 family protein [Rhizobiales bacterium]|nr:DUF1178 family protein [Hyphomicrobiales bacterium]MBI3672810.1 DUF1178 family protein [Hyphomicrobiales bacterium]